MTELSIKLYETKNKLHSGIIKNKYETVSNQYV